MPQKRTDLQQAAARANGAKSRGPVTPRGKELSSRNSLKHGLLAQSLLLPNESRDRFNDLIDALWDEYHPETFVERIFVQRMVAAQWRLIRIWAYENAGMLQETAAVSELPPTITDEGVWHNPAARSVAAFQALHGRAGTGSILQISEVRYQRQFAQAVAQLRRHRAENMKNIETNPGNP